MAENVDMWLPDPNWSGNSGIDFELWTPIWSFLPYLLSRAHAYVIAKQ
jgi:hypothetical protein